ALAEPPLMFHAIDPDRSSMMYMSRGLRSAFCDVSEHESSSPPSEPLQLSSQPPLPPLPPFPSPPSSSPVPSPPAPSPSAPGRRGPSRPPSVVPQAGTTS